MTRHALVADDDEDCRMTTLASIARLHQGSLHSTGLSLTNEVTYK